MPLRPVPPPHDPSLLAARRGASTLIRVRGELDLARVDELQSLLDGARLQAGTQVVVDLRACPFIDSSVIACLLSADGRAAARGAEVVVLVAPGPVRRTLDLVGVSAILTVVEDRGSRQQSSHPAPHLTLIHGGAAQE